MRRRDVSGTVVLGAAGWLFAELAMILTVVAIGSEQQAAPTTARPRAATTVAAPTTVATPGTEQGLALTSVTFTMPVPEDDRAVVDTFAGELGRLTPARAKVGLVMLFGKSLDADPVDGVGVSRRVSALLGSADLPQLRSALEIRTYFGGDGPPGSVTVELFLMTGPA